MAKLKVPVAADVRRLTSKAGEKSEPAHVGCYEEGQTAAIDMDAETMINTSDLVLGTRDY